MVSDRIEISNEIIDGYRFEVARFVFDGIRKTAGYNRYTWTDRLQFRVNGIIMPRITFHALKKQAKKTTL